MPIPEPPADFDLWPEVRAVTGWPASDEDRVRTLAAGWRAGGEGFARAGGHDVGALADAWPDRAGQALHTNVRTTLDRAVTVGDGMARMAGHAETFAAELTGVKQGINDLMAKNIALYGREVATLPAAVQPVAHAGFVQQLAGMVTEMMAASAARIGAAQGLQDIAPAQDAAPAVPPEFAPGTDPAQVRQAWDRLSVPEKYALVNSDPDAIRNLDGIPPGFREMANLAVVDRELAALEDREHALRVQPGRQQDANIVRDNIAGLKSLVAWAEGDPDLFLLGLDSAGDGKVIVASGNPDTAANVVTHIPGLGTTWRPRPVPKVWTGRSPCGSRPAVDRRTRTRRRSTGWGTTPPTASGMRARTATPRRARMLYSVSSSGSGPPTTTPG